MNLSGIETSKSKSGRSVAGLQNDIEINANFDHGGGSTFSQVFETIENTAHYQKEVSDINQNAVTSNNMESSSTLSAIAGEQTSVSTFANGATSATNAEMANPRDNHAYLQPHVLHVSNKQRGNAVLKLIRNVPYTFSSMVPDFICGSNRCALFLSLKYHNLHPAYIHHRISELKTDFVLRILLCLVDIEDNAAVLLSLNKIAVLNNLTFLLCWSNEEAARYLETFKAYESKDASSIQKREKDNFIDQVADVLTTVRSINKTDSSQLLSQFGSLKQLIGTPMDELSLCPGIGEKKVRRLFDAFHKPFNIAASKRRIILKEGTEERGTRTDDD